MQQVEKDRLIEVLMGENNPLHKVCPLTTAARSKSSKLPQQGEARGSSRGGVGRDDADRLGAILGVRLELAAEHRDLPTPANQQHALRSEEGYRQPSSERPQAAGRHERSGSEDDG